MLGFLNIERYVLIALLAVCGFLYVTKLSVQKEFAEYKEAALMALVTANETNDKIEAKRTEENDKLNETYFAREQVLRSDLAAALRELRIAKAAANRAPAKDAPAECRAYEAPPSQLSQQDAEFLVRLANEADELAAQLKLAQDYIEKVVWPKDG